MNGRRAKAERRRLAELAVEPKREEPTPARALGPNNHPLGPLAGATVQYQRGLKLQMIRIMEENRRALEQCTTEPGCPSSVHYPSCMAVR